ncbi:MAG: ABC transporter ATP-binding protein [Mariprofundaceae bacterium]|nr:ABC transporter ATP-binding protein [Mariprofundaceae bacterium]
MSVLSIHRLSLSRGGHAIAGSLDMRIEAGKVTVVLGPNGAGKSSLLLAMAGMLASDVGHIGLQGRDIRTLSRRQIAESLTWQGDLPPTDFGLTVRQRLELAVREVSSKALEQIAGTLDIGHILMRRLGELSAGERQRIELAAVLLRDTPVALLDEPTAHLDLRHQSVWLALMRRQADAGRAVVAVLHDVQQAACVADTVLFVYGDGRVEHGEARDMLTPLRLEALFHMPVLHLQNGRLIVPDYRSGIEAA